MRLAKVHAKLQILEHDWFKNRLRPVVRPFLVSEHFLQGIQGSSRFVQIHKLCRTRKKPGFIIVWLCEVIWIQRRIYKWILSSVVVFPYQNGFRSLQVVHRRWSRKIGDIVGTCNVEFYREIVLTIGPFKGIFRSLTVSSHVVVSLITSLTQI